VRCPLALGCLVRHGFAMPVTLKPDMLMPGSRPIDHLALGGARDAPALLLRDGMVSYAQLEARIGRLAALIADHGLAAGERVACWLGKGELACLLPLAVARAGLVHVPINPLLKRAQVAHILNDSGARLLITNPGRAGTLARSDVPAHCHILDDSVLLGAAQLSGARLPPSDAPPGTLAAILYTSGSTGKPKGVMLSHANLWLGADAVADYLELTATDRLLGLLPLSFDYGQNQLLSAWKAGASVAPLDYLTPADVVRAVAKHGITTIAGVPPLWVQLIEIDWPPAVAAQLKRLTNSGGALTRRLITRLTALFPAADIYAMYGLTEAFRSTYLNPALIASRPDSIGLAIPHAEVLVVRADGTLTNPDEPGELVHCGPLVAQGYWKDAARTADRFKPAPRPSRYGGMAVWSGDTVVRDADGYLTFVGRDDAMIKSAGNRISPSEVEEAAEATGLVAEAVAFGVADEALGQVVVLVVRASREAAAADDPDDPAEALRQKLRADLPNFMQPRHILLRDHLPRNANGKIDRVAIIKAATHDVAAALAA
jgi:acyl-CoA ligase (AMP-forming) (exosortase A-associated)